MKSSEESQTSGLGGLLVAVEPLQPPPPHSCLDPKGDLYIEVGMCPEQSFMVCSTTLARTAPFWDKMLYGEFKEGKKLCLQNNNLKWTVKLPEDNPTAIALLLNIVHSRFDKVPGYKDPLNVRDLYEISVLTDKYNITYTLQPWAKGWLPSVHRSAKRIDESLQAQFRHERLWISWVLGDRTKFEKIAKILLLNSCGSKGNPNSLQYAKVLEPPEIYDIIEQTRSDTIKALLAPLHATIEGLITSDESLCTSKIWNNHSPNICLPSMLGTYIQSLHSVGL